jgi:hypothetical protein
VVVVRTKNENGTTEIRENIPRSRFSIVYVRIINAPSTELDRAVAKYYIKTLTSHLTTTVITYKNWPIRYGEGVGDNECLLNMSTHGTPLCLKAADSSSTLVKGRK